MKQSGFYDWEAMRAVDIRTVDPATLTDIREIKINLELPFTEKALDYLHQIKNAYCFRCGDTIVRTSHINTGVSLADRLKQYLLSGQGMTLT